MDVAHCRINLLDGRLDTADVFTRERERHTARSFHPWADIATIIGLLDPEPRHPPASMQRFAIESILQHAVNKIDGP
jgi:hypothetical protein